MDKLILGSYEVEKQFGEGSFGAVFVGYWALFHHSQIFLKIGFDGVAFLL